jgi:two-component system copper resistance phosphate regulon response regulator CusR
LRILVIEDEKKTAAFIQKGLREHGMFVDTAKDGETGLWMAREGSYELIILDVMLPKLDGWAVIKTLRDGGAHTPVIFLTARDGVQDRVKGLDLGADDYLVKPFAFSELVARVRTILRRGPVRQEERIRIADLEIDPRQHKATRNGRLLHLTPKEMQLLTLLGRFAGEVVARSSISEQVWDINFDTGTNMVEAAMRRLRAKVDDPFEKKLIHTVRGIGYVLEER